MEIRKYNQNGTFYSFGNQTDLVSMFLLKPEMLGNMNEISKAVNEGYSPVHSCIFNGNIKIGPNERKAFVTADEKSEGYVITILRGDEYGRPRRNSYLANPKLLEYAVSERLLFVDKENCGRLHDVFLEALAKKFGEGNIFMVKAEKEGFLDGLTGAIMGAYQRRAKYIDQTLGNGRVA